MRVTNFGVNAQYMSDLNSVMTKYQHLEQELSTGRKLNQPSDDPVAFETDILSQSQLTQVSQWQSNVSSGLTFTQNTDAAMQTLLDQLGNVRTKLLDAVNGTHTPEDLKAIQSYIQQQVASVAQTANTYDGQQYIFGGTQGKNPLVSVDPTTYQLTWVPTGDTPSRTLDIGKRTQTTDTRNSVAIGVDGTDLFNGGTTAPSSASGLISTLNQILSDVNQAATAASPSDPSFTAGIASIRNDLNSLDTNISNVTAMHADLGGRMDRIQSAETQLKQVQTALSTQKGKAEDANVAEVVTQLTMQQTVYQAALSTGSRMILPTLADTLK